MFGYTKELAKKAEEKANAIVRVLVPKMMEQRKQYPANVPYSDYRLAIDASESLTIRIYRPQQNQFSTPPTLLHIPATAFILDIEKKGSYFHEVTGSHLAEKSGCNVVIIKHRIGPTCSPIFQLNDCQRVITWLYDNYKTLDIDIQNIAITGYCTGATFANAISVLDSANKKFKIPYQILISPLTDLTRIKKGYEDIEAKDLSTPEGFMEKIILYSGISEKDLKLPLVSPYWQNWSKIEKSCFPVTDIIVGQHDKLYGDAYTYNASLNSSKFVSTLFPIKDGNHGSFWFDISVICLMAQRVRWFFKLASIDHHLLCDKNKKKKKGYVVICNKAKLKQQNNNKHCGMHC